MYTNNGVNKKTVSIIILSYNSCQDLMECIPSILEQIGSDHEIIVVDNGSVDGTESFIKKNYSNIQFIENGSNLGYAAGNNIGFRHAKGEYIVVVNPDTIPGNNWLSALIAPLQMNPEIAITTSKILMHTDKHLINTCANHSHYTGLNFCRGLNQLSSSFKKPLEVGAISGCSFATRRKVIEELGGFDSNFFLYMEDDDLSWRARLAGYKIMFVPSSVIYHKYRLTIAPWKEYYLERNRYILLLKNYRLKTLFLLLPVLLVTEAITWGHAILNGLPYMQSKLRAYWWLISNLNLVIPERKEIQSYRKISDKELIKLLDWRIPFEQVIVNESIKNQVDKIFNSIYKIYFYAIIKIV
ncbi:putative glycosyltransferase [Methanocella paludicola SANAE]|uniref:Glycosyltransferase n=1 Tax=Methanocella paludicola (strain DSM 17711 / JCM 13418 / NBRC 101707 / SANAE) TaxID=304371 RepID=D1YZX8_METPS|nr:glycosyltransferase family 2 protein [Methanocella paludicola]BAI62000.1 putative glycosyltransferase [Methanocella paludicola SANAE]